MSDDNSHLKVVINNDLEAPADEQAQLYKTVDLHDHKFSGHALTDAVDIIDRGREEALPANDLKDLAIKLSILGMSESHIKRLGRLDRAMNMIEQQLATPDRLAQMTTKELTNMYKLLGTSLEVSQKYVKESMWSVNVGELQEQITDLVSGGSNSDGDEGDHSTREVVTDIFRRVSTLGQTIPTNKDVEVPEVNPQHLPNDLLDEEGRKEAEKARVESNKAVVEEAREEHRKQQSASTPKLEQKQESATLALPDDDTTNGVPCAGLDEDQWELVMAEEMGESGSLDLSDFLAPKNPTDDDVERIDPDEIELIADAPLSDEESALWGDDTLGGKDDPLADFDMEFDV
ncbi:MAG: hypothetical protein GY833_21935 [Aestuariibacter sp.]|nr:hypothetical protein [Aestuariibacter sp.]|tara:strand:+ start:82205 stop:83242 length:1038 start_codon:yes stop_codon:yes gene_type:complete